MRLAADANVLLSAILGGRAKLILEHERVEEVVTAEPTFEEVQQYENHLARKKRLSLDLVLLTMAALPVRIVERDAFWRWRCTSACPSGRMTTTSRMRVSSGTQTAELLAELGIGK